MRVRVELKFGFGLAWLGRVIQSWLDRRRMRRMDELLRMESLSTEEKQELDSLVSLVGGNKIVIGG